MYPLCLFYSYLADPESIPSNWKSHVDNKSGKKYYANIITKKVQWKKPQCLKKSNKRKSIDSANSSSSNSSQVSNNHASPRPRVISSSGLVVQPKRAKNGSSAPLPAPTTVTNRPEPSSASSTSAPLPTGWETNIDGKGRRYYFHRVIYSFTHFLNRNPVLQLGNCRHQSPKLQNHHS